MESKKHMTNRQRARLLFTIAAGLSCLLSVGLWFRGFHDEAVFVGIWVPSILSLGTLMLNGVPR